MNSLKRQQINELLARYAAARDQVIWQEKRLDEIRKQIIATVPSGKYDHASVYESQAQKIEVRSYIRRGFKAIRIK